jgi:serine/threonine protein kinase
VVELPVISDSELILEKEGVGEGESRRAYWRNENKFVSLFLLEKNENLNYSHQHILPIYAEVRMGGQHYVVSDEYRNCSLSHLIQEFGPFPEPLAKRYLKQIGLGLQHLHYHKKSHNQLNPRTILYNKQGNLFINMIKAAAGYRRKD